MSEKIDPKILINIFPDFNGSTPTNKLNNICEKLKICIILHKYVKGNLRIYKYGKKFDNIIDIACYREHFFIYEKIDHIEFNRIFNKRKTGLNSLKLIVFLDKKKYFTRFRKLNINNQNAIDFMFNENFLRDENDIRKKQSKKDNFEKIADYKIIFADCEADSTKDIHEVYMIAFKYLKLSKINIISGPLCIETFFNCLPTKSIIYFHNLKYDICFLFKHIKAWSVCKKNGAYYEIKSNYKNKKIIFRDSYKLIPTALKEFSEMFSIKTEKEIFPYEYYTLERFYSNEYGKIDEAMNFIKNNTKDEFITSLKKSKSLINDNEFDMKKYAEFYCSQDVNLLSQGMMKFSETIKNLFDVNIYDCLSLSSIVIKILEKYNVFEDSYEYRGFTQNYLMKNVRGGYVNSKNGQKWLIKDKIQDFDAVSLYPSAICRICNENGFPTQTHKILLNNQKNMDFLNKLYYYTVRIKISQINKKLPMPLLSYLDDMKCRKYSDDIDDFMKKDRNIFVVDKITLEDYIKYHEIEFEILDGIYWDSFNNKYGKIMNILFELRKKYKAEGNIVYQLIIKLLMNSSYGKLIIKPSKHRYIFINKEDIQNYIAKHHNRVISYIDFGKNYCVKEKNFLLSNFNMPHWGGYILSMSKRILNEVHYIANTFDINIFYQDTDSIHIFDRDIKKLSEEYDKKYNKKLIGSELGQFHSDFQFDKKNPIKPIGKITSKICIILGKKSYIDILEDEKGNIDYHIRMKGIPNYCIENLCKNYDMTYEKLYKRLYDGFPCVFDLTETKNKFKINENNTVSNVYEFTRLIKF